MSYLSLLYSISPLSCADVSSLLQDQVGHDAPEEADQQPEGERERGGGGAGEEGAQLPDGCSDETKIQGLTSLSLS